VLLRLFLAIPLAVVVLAIGIATFVVVVIGWFAAVFIGRVPDFVRNLVTIYLRMGLRLQAYVMLLTDRFPPFDTEDVPDYPVHVAVPFATPMNRAAVFFRIVLAVPASLLGGVLGSGYAVLAFFMWIVMLITGWLPASVHDGYRGILRFQTRLSAYTLLLVPTYPAKLFGDGETGVAPPTSAVVVAPAGADGGGAVVPPAPAWNLFLGKGGKRVLLLVIILGVPAYFGSWVLRFTEQDHRGFSSRTTNWWPASTSSSCRRTNAELLRLRCHARRMPIACCRTSCRISSTTYEGRARSGSARPSSFR
jgi:hypothetical protein